MYKYEPVYQRMNGVGNYQLEYKFPNGYGASVIRGPKTYGGNKGLWTLAVVGPDDSLCYDTPITNDVIGWLSEDEVEKILDKIKELPKRGE